MNFTIPQELKIQMAADSIDFIHVRDGISVDIKPDGSYTTDWDFKEKTLLRDEYIQKISDGLGVWFDSLTSDSAFYRNVEDNFINVHAEDLEDLL